MTEMRSSSNRTARVCDAVLMKDEQTMGPIRLPENRADDFIAQFNRTYEGLGIKLAPIVHPVNEKIPGSVNAAGDDVSSEPV
jgi:hypothetical protein